MSSCPFMSSSSALWTAPAVHAHTKSSIAMPASMSARVVALMHAARTPPSAWFGFGFGLATWSSVMLTSICVRGYSCVCTTGSKTLRTDEASSESAVLLGFLCWPPEKGRAEYVQCSTARSCCALRCELTSCGPVTVTSTLVLPCSR